MASGPITLWQIDGETVETVSDFIFLGSIITANGDCSHEIKRHLFLGRKAMTNLDSILKSRDITLPTKVHLVKAMVFPVVMYGCESWSCWIELLEFFIYFEYYPLIRNMVCKYFFHYIDYHFILLIIFFAIQKVLIWCIPTCLYFCCQSFWYYIKKNELPIMLSMLCFL